MHEAELQHFKGTIQRMMKELERPLRRREAIVVEHSADTLDQVENAANRDLAAVQLELHSSRLRELRAARERIEDGTYGLCLECESEISARRLNAVPWTCYCIDCQHTMEQNSSQAGPHWNRAFPVLQH